MLSLIVLLLILLSNRALFLPGTLSSGDWPYLFLENIQEFSFLPDPHSLWLGAYYQIPTKILVEYLHIPWELTEKLLWFWPFLLLSIASSYYLTKSWLGVLIYTTNTYILMVVGGGQMGIAMAYAIVPFILKKFMDFATSNFSLIQSKEMFKGSIILGLMLAVLTMFDPRIAYIFMIAVAVYALVIIIGRKSSFLHNTYFFFNTIIVPVGIAALLNSYWVIPLLLNNLPQKYEGLSSIAGFEFLSFADFSHALSLLHPNWPQNIFGKTYFMQPEFILLPLMAFSALLFINGMHKKLSIETKNIYFFIILGLIGVFLAKGVNQPFGELNSWLFKNFPGMSMFRDSTKFYLLIVLSYSVLIPFSIYSISNWFNSKFIPIQSGQNSKLQNKIQNLFLLLFVGFWLSLIYPAVFGQLTGTFKSQKVPGEYMQLKEFLHAHSEYFKTLWIPSVQRFGYISKNHPALSATDYLQASSISSVLAEIKNPKTKVKLLDSSIKYLIVPYDVKKELFITDRAYDEKLYKKIIEQLEQLSWLGRKKSFGDIIIFEIQ